MKQSKPRNKSGYTRKYKGDASFGSTKEGQKQSQQAFKKMFKRNKEGKE